jgi:hypothetical protein
MSSTIVHVWFITLGLVGAAGAVAQEAPDALDEPAATDASPPAPAPTPIDEQAPAEADPSATDSDDAEQAPGEASDTAVPVDPSESDPPAPVEEQPPTVADTPPTAEAPITENIGERDNPSVPSFARTTVVSQEVALSPGEMATVVGASAAGCVGCTAVPCAAGVLGCGATVFFSSAYSPCVAIGGGTASALFGIGGCTAASVPFLIGPANVITNFAATTGALLFGTDFDLDLVLRVLAGGAPGALMAVLSVAALVVGLGVLVLGLMAAPALGAGSLVLAIMPGAAVLATAAFNGFLAGTMTFAGITATSLTNTRWSDSGTLEDPAAPPPTAARYQAPAVMAF